jgi:hypothetical protein
MFLTLLPLLVLEHLHGHEGSTAGEKLVAELGLVVILVDLVVVVLGIALRVLAAGNGHRVANYLTETEHIG